MLICVPYTLFEVLIYFANGVSYKVARKVGRSFVGEFNTARLLVEVRYNKKRGLCIVHLRPLVTCVITLRPPSAWASGPRT